MQINYDYDMIVTMIMVVTSKDESVRKKKQINIRMKRRSNIINTFIY